MDLSGYVLATIHKDTETLLCRGRAATGSSPDPPSILVSMPISEHSVLARGRMLEHELALRPELDATWAVRPLTLAQYRPYGFDSRRPERRAARTTHLKGACWPRCRRRAVH